MKAYKEKQFLVFDFENGKNVKYDLSNSCMIGKRGNPVIGLNGQLSGYGAKEIIDSFQDDKYKQFLNFIYKNNEGCYWNIGTLLKKIESYSRFEQFFSAGITNISPYLYYKINDIPKDLIKLSVEHEFQLTNKVVEQYKIHKDIIRNIFETEYLSISKNDINYCILDSYGYRPTCEDFNELIQTYKYKYNTLLRYIDNLITYEALDGLSNVIRELHDYANMMSKLSNKYEKYPKNFLTTHRIASRNYNRLKQTFPEELFQTIRNEKFECYIGEYKILYPPDTQSIKDEAVQQQNCLASYIQKVLDGKCHILFMRLKEESEKSLVTLEIRNWKVVQAKGKFNRDLTDEEQEAVNKYNEKLIKIKLEE